MKFLQSNCVTGAGRVAVQYPYRDYDLYGHGNAAAMTGGFLDAPERPPSGASTALHAQGTSGWRAQMANPSSPHACAFGLCVCGGDGKTVHVRNA